MKYGYARVSTLGQKNDGNSLEDQKNQLEEYGCDEIIVEAYSGSTNDRPKFNELINKLQEGDMLVVTKLDRFSRNIIEGATLVDELYNRGVKIFILNMGIIENTGTGKLIKDVMLSFADYERNQIRERTERGKEIARQKENYREGRPRVYTEEQIEHALDLLNNGDSYTEVSKKTGLSKSTLIRHKKMHG